jgi:hypothetical protein
MRRMSHRAGGQISRFVAAVLIVSSQLAVTAHNIPARAWAGKWKINLAQSSFPGRPAPQDDELTIEADGTVTVFETNSQGKKSSWSYKPQAGRRVTVSGRENWTVIARKVNDHRTEQEWNFNGHMAKSWAILSEDGKRQTFHLSGTNEAGKPFHQVVVYDRQ